MNASTFTESVVEEAALTWLENLGYASVHGLYIACGMPAAERSEPNFRDVFLGVRLCDALLPKLNSAELRMMDA